MESPIQFPCDEVYHSKNLIEKKHPYFGKSMGTNFPGSSHKIGLVDFFIAIGYRWEDLYFFLVNHRMKI